MTDEKIIIKKKTMKTYYPGKQGRDMRPARDAILMFIGLLVIWTIYRFVTPDGRYTMWISDFFAKILVWILPVFVYYSRKNGYSLTDWKMHLYSVGIRSKNLKNVAIFALIFTVVLNLFWSYMDAFSAYLFGILKSGPEFHMNTSDPILFTLFIINCFLSIGPGEEIFNRGFVQKELTKSFNIYVGIVGSAIVFASSHIPISIFIHHYNFLVLMSYMVFTFSFGIIMSYFFIKTGNLIGPILLHGLWDLFAFTNTFGVSEESINDLGYFFFSIVSSSIAIAFSVVVIFFSSLYLGWERKKQSCTEIMSRIKHINKNTFKTVRAKFVVGLIVIYLIAIPLSAATISISNSENGNEIMNIHFQYYNPDIDLGTSSLQTGSCQNEANQFFTLPKNVTTLQVTAKSLMSGIGHIKDSVKVTVTSPEGKEQSFTLGPGGSDSIVFNLNAKQDDMNTTKDKLSEVLANATGTIGAGKWSVNMAFNEHGLLGSQEVKVTATYTHYLAEVNENTSSNGTSKDY